MKGCFVRARSHNDIISERNLSNHVYIEYIYIMYISTQKFE